MGGFGCHTGRSLPHTAAVAPESLRSCLGRAGIGTPDGGCEGTRRGPSPTQRRSCPVPLVLPGPRRDRDTPRAEDSTRGVSSTQRRLHPSPSGGAGAAEGYGHPVGVWARGEVHHPHNGGHTRVPPVPPGPRRGRDPPRGFGDSRRGLAPTQRRSHPAPPQPCLSRGGIGAPRGGSEGHSQFAFCPAALHRGGRGAGC